MSSGIPPPSSTPLEARQGRSALGVLPKHQRPSCGRPWLYSLSQELRSTSVDLLEKATRKDSLMRRLVEMHFAEPAWPSAELGVD